MLFSRLLKKGEGSPLLFLHGFMGSGIDWQPIVSQIKNRTCIAPDLPGHGKTPWTNREISDLLVETLPQEAVDLVGYSLGGRLAIRFAMRYPERIRSLTLLSSHYGLKTEEEKQKRLKADQAWALKFRTEPFGKIIEQWYSQDVFSSLKEKPKLLQEMISKRAAQDPTFLAKALETWSLGLQECAEEFLRTLPRLKIFYGSLDHKFAALYSGWDQAHEIPNAGHCLHLEAPKTITEAL